MLTSVGQFCSKELPKEYVEIHSDGTSVILNDFKGLSIYKKGKPFKKKLFNQNKGQKEMVEQFFEGLLKSGKAPITPEEIFVVTRATFKVLESLKGDGVQIKI